MPELPEVETIRRQLDPEIVGRRIERLRILDERWCRPAPPAPLERACAGRVIVAVGRRGKYLLLGLDDGMTLLMHLRMTGNLLLEPAAAAHLRAEIVLDDRRAVKFTDPRRFGQAALLDPRALEQHLDQRLGVEPLSGELTAGLIERLTARRTAPLKSFLLDQRQIAGIGNIYADEALHRARLHPLSPAGSIRAEHAGALRVGIVAALEAGLSNGGASIDDYRDLRGEAGAMQDEFLVHTREGEPCPRCGEPIVRIVISGRSSYFCAACQVRLRRRPRRGYHRRRAGRR